MTAVHYHAGMAKDKRQIAQDAWMKGDIPVMIATTAFGMGIDKANVRSVIHYDAPEHMEAYYQESGRAGRDGKPATSLLLFNNVDIERLQDSIELQFPKEPYLKQVYQAVVEYLQIAIGTEPHRYYDFDLHSFCKRFKLEALPASHALKLLEQEDLWTISESVFKPATVHIVANRDELEELNSRYPQLGWVVTILLRLYGTIATYPTTIRLLPIAKQLKISQPDTEQYLLQLHQMDIIEYQKPIEGAQLFFHHYRVDSKHLLINMQRIAILRKRHEKRTREMIAFMQEKDVCRTRLLLQYFDEDVSADCDHCDVCAKKTMQPPVAKQLKLEILKKLRNGNISSVQQLAIQFPAAIREDIVTLVRQMADERVLKLHENGMLSVI
jgi:ATP-dependent DNA helicase RecQ